MTTRGEAATKFDLGDEIAAQFVLDMNLDDVVEVLLRRGEAELAGAGRVESRVTFSF